MKLRTKLISSFGSVLLVTLFLFGIITYYTFTESTKQSVAELLRLKTLEINYQSQALLTGCLQPLQSLLPPYSAFMSNTQEISVEKLKVFVETEPFVNGLFVFANDELIAAVPPSAEDSQDIVQSYNKQLILKKAAWPRLEATTDGFAFFLDYGSIHQNFDYDLVVILAHDRFADYLHNLLKIDGGTLFISQDDVFHFLAGSIPASSASKSLLEATQETILDHSLVSYESQYLYSSPAPYFSWHLNIAVPQHFLFVNLIKLKNRIITAMIILGWFSIWVILIISYTISKPIQMLSKLTKNIIDFDYTSSFEFQHGDDEIGELSQSFETMRRKIMNLITKDPLTRVYNRRFLMHIFELAVLKANRLEKPLACIMLDIDNFKSVNDTYGHQVGDAVLVELGSILLETTRGYDTPARYGGEEFIIVLPDTDIGVAYQIAERIRKSMEIKKVPWDGGFISCTVSLGISGYELAKAHSPLQIINHADMALYEAKKGGRNQTVIHEAHMDSCHICEDGDEVEL